MVEQFHLQIEEPLVIELPLEDVWVWPQVRGQSSVEMDIFTNISVEIWVQPSYVYGFFGLPGDLGGILIYNAKT